MTFSQGLPSVETTEKFIDLLECVAENGNLKELSERFSTVDIFNVKKLKDITYAVVKYLINLHAAMPKPQKALFSTAMTLSMKSDIKERLKSTLYAIAKFENKTDYSKYDIKPPINDSPLLPENHKFMSLDILADYCKLLKTNLNTYIKKSRNREKHDICNKLIEFENQCFNLSRVKDIELAVFSDDVKKLYKFYIITESLVRAVLYAQVRNICLAISSFHDTGTLGNLLQQEMGNLEKYYNQTARNFIAHVNQILYDRDSYSKRMREIYHSGDDIKSHYDEMKKRIKSAYKFKSLDGAELEKIIERVINDDFHKLGNQEVNSSSYRPLETMIENENISSSVNMLPT